MSRARDCSAQQLHGDVPAVVGFAALDDVHDVGMVQPFGDQRLVLEALFLVLVVEIFLFQDLERHDALLVEHVLGLVDRGHAARADGLQDLEVADLGPFLPEGNGVQDTFSAAAMTSTDNTAKARAARTMNHQVW